MGEEQLDDLIRAVLGPDQHPSLKAAKTVAALHRERAWRYYWRLDRAVSFVMAAPNWPQRDAMLDILRGMADGEPIDLEDIGNPSKEERARRVTELHRLIDSAVDALKALGEDVSGIHLPPTKGGVA